MSLLSKWKHNLQARGKSRTRFRGTGCHRSCVTAWAEWPWRAQTGTKVGVGWGKRHQCPLIQQTCSCPNPQGPAPSVSIGTLSVCLSSPHRLRLSMCWGVPKSCSGAVGKHVSSQVPPCTGISKDRQCGSQGRALWRDSEALGLLCCAVDKSDPGQVNCPFSLFHFPPARGYNGWSLSSDLLLCSWESW